MRLSDTSFTQDSPSIITTLEDILNDIINSSETSEDKTGHLIDRFEV